MTRDVETLRAWIRIVVVITAFCTTAVPIAYSFSAWRTSKIGQLFMWQAISFAVAMDVTAIFSIWMPPGIDLLIIFWINICLMTGVAISTASMAFWIIKTNYFRK